MVKQPVPAPEPVQPGIEESLDTLEGIVKRLESGEETLDGAVQLFEEGMRLSADCRKRLEEAEARVEILMKQAGSEVAQPFSPEEE
ncbi:MAG: exodeoxyribonuclease VII small subunit [Bryobacteraceae bacterium]|nr:exodeoxyribonuclease VII small subunit [Bryobacteraceae bacterium]